MQIKTLIASVSNENTGFHRFLIDSTC